MDCDTPEVVIKAGWAVDNQQSMTDSFKVNHPKAQVCASGCQASPLLCRDEEQAGCKAAVLGCMLVPGHQHLITIEGLCCCWSPWFVGQADSTWGGL